MDSIFLDGSSLTFEKLRNIQNLSQKVEITSEAWIKIDKARAVIDGN
jgi:histidine ammonia-lyase